LKFSAIATSLLVATVALVALAPTAQAVDTWCIAGEPNCPPGQLFCVLYPVQQCVIDPCYTTSCWTQPAEAPAPDTAECYQLAHGPGFDSYLCYDVKGALGCKVYTETYRWETGRTRNCIA
jgi:hypothetical protein